MARNRQRGRYATSRAHRRGKERFRLRHDVPKKETFYGALGCVTPELYFDGLQRSRRRVISVAECKQKLMTALAAKGKLHHANT